jgi:hypothetical protein
LARLGEGIAPEQVIRRAIFLDDDDYVLNLRNVVLGVSESCGESSQKQ